MENIEAEMVKKALATFVAFISQERTGDNWLDKALGYVLFAAQEKHRFRCINDKRHTPLQKQFAREHWMKQGEALSGDERFKDIPEPSRHKVRVARWILIHGWSSLIASGWFKTPIEADTVLAGEFGYSPWSNS